MHEKRNFETSEWVGSKATRSTVNASDNIISLKASPANREVSTPCLKIHEIVFCETAKISIWLIEGLTEIFVIFWG